MTPRAAMTPGAETAGEQAAEQLQRRLAWQCRRGTRELDFLLAGFLRTRYPHASSAARAAFARLLELQDPELQDYLLGNVEPQDAGLRDVVRSIAGHQP
jgi:antitoxin CptB